MRMLGNDGAPFRPKSDLNEIYYLSVREIMTIENMISQVTFC